ncbi:MAG: TRAP transporter large permease subunit [Candidatus Binataceae bacterium]
MHYRTRLVINPHAESLSWRDKVNLGAFVFVVGGLVTLMATIFLAPMFAALYMFCAAGAALFLIHLASLLRPGRWSFAEFIAPFQRVLDSFIEMISDISMLLATLAILTGALVITGVPTKLGFLLVDAAGINMTAMVLMAFIFGAILGMGLPPAPVYILVAIVIAPPFMHVGVNPWVIHFFAFFIGVFGELTPPTSITAAITSKIAGASFYATLWRSVQICVSLFTLMAGVFVHPQLVIVPGLGQLFAALLVATSTLGITFSLQATFSEKPLLDRCVRIGLAAVALVTLLSTNDTIATLACVPVLAAIAYWIVFRRKIEEVEPDVVVIDPAAAPLVQSAAGGSALGRIN